MQQRPLKPHETVFPQVTSGLSHRSLFAAFAMQALIAKYPLEVIHEQRQAIAGDAAMLADELIAALGLERKGYY